MEAVDLGFVLMAMAGYAKQRAEDRRSDLGANTELLYALAFTFQTGAEKCIEIARQEKAARDA